MILPSKASLNRWTKKYPSQPGFSPFLLNEIKSMAKNFNEQEKCCVLLFDEMKIKENYCYSPTKDIVIGHHDTGYLRKKGKASQPGKHWF